MESVDFWPDRTATDVHDPRGELEHFLDDRKRSLASGWIKGSIAVLYSPAWKTLDSQLSGNLPCTCMYEPVLEV